MIIDTDLVTLSRLPFTAVRAVPLPVRATGAEAGMDSRHHR